MSDSGMRDVRSCNPTANKLKLPESEPNSHSQQHPCIDQGLKTPTHKTYNWSTGWSNGDSPGNGGVSQDIIWDSTSPNTRNGPSDNRVIEISDVVKRIAPPKNGKPVGPVSPWRQWISDSAMICTPENPQTRVRRKSIRQSNAEDLMKLARQFDNNLREHGETPVGTTLTEMAPQSDAGVQESFHTMWEQTVGELEFQALFDSSTQQMSRGLSSQGSSVSNRSQGKEDCPGGQATSAANGVPPQQTKLMSAGSSSQQYKSLHAMGASPTKDERSSSDVGVAKFDNVDDDWDNDDLLLDSFELTMNQLSEPPGCTVQSSTSRSSTNQQPSDCQPHTNGSSAGQVSCLPPQPNGRSLQQLCSKPKTSNRSTFKLESNPHFQPSSLASDLNMDTTWDNLDDDLLYQVCENVEKISNTELAQARAANCQGNTKDCQQKVTTPLAIKTRSINGAESDSVKRQLPCTFVRSNSLPVATNYQGWNIPFNAAAAPQSVMSQSHPGTLEGLGTFSHLKDSSGTFQANMAIQPRTVTARPTQNSSHSSFKRTLSDSAVASNKVLVTNQTTAKCSAAEIERKKREALARRRQRMQMSQKR